MAVHHRHFAEQIGVAQFREPQFPEAERILDELMVGFSNEEIQPIFLTWVCSGLGDLDSAFEWLEKSVLRVDPAASFIGFPPMDTLREYTLLNNLWASGQAPWKTWKDAP